MTWLFSPLHWHAPYVAPPVPDEFLGRMTRGLVEGTGDMTRGLVAQSRGDMVRPTGNGARTWDEATTTWDEAVWDWRGNIRGTMRR